MQEDTERSLSCGLPFPPALEEFVSQVLLEGLARAALLDKARSILSPRFLDLRRTACVYAAPIQTSERSVAKPATLGARRVVSQCP